jgi:hypothetical protein
MLNQEREQNYRVQIGQWQLPLPTSDVLTGPQKRRLHKKQHAHSHFANGSCDRCRSGSLRDTQRSTASTGPVTKWERT